MKTREEIDKLKRSWNRDPCWDIEETEGFEDHKQELLEYREQCEAAWEKKNQERKLHYRKTRPAFPTFEEHHDYDGRYLGLTQADGGMALRDYFAGQVLAGFWSTNTDFIDKDVAEVVAAQCYTIADAMLEAREKEE